MISGGYFPLTFGLNAGWLFITSVVNVSAYLVQIEWDRFGISDGTWAIIMLVTSVALVLIVGLNIEKCRFFITDCLGTLRYFSMNKLSRWLFNSSRYCNSGNGCIIIVSHIYVRNNKAIMPVVN